MPVEGLAAICLATPGDAVYEAGETRHAFTLQSISKPLTYGLASTGRSVRPVIATGRSRICFVPETW